MTNNNNKSRFEIHVYGQPLRNADIQPGGTYRTMRFGKVKVKGEKPEAHWGIVRLKEGSTTDIEVSYNLSTLNQWDKGGNINPDAHRVQFFPALPEHIDHVDSVLNLERSKAIITNQQTVISLNDDRHRALLAELDYTNDRLKRTYRIAQYIERIMHRFGR